MISKIKLTVLFSDPFWIGVFEVIENNNLKICKVTFGSEPKDEEIYKLILSRFYSLNFSNPILSCKSAIVEKKQNPKKLQRKIKEETSAKGLSTKAQIAIKLQHEQLKIEYKKITKEQRDQKEQRKFYLKQKKRLKKHKGH